MATVIVKVDTRAIVLTIGPFASGLVVLALSLGVLTAASLIAASSASVVLRGLLTSDIERWAHEFQVREGKVARLGDGEGGDTVEHEFGHVRSVGSSDLNVALLGDLGDGLVTEVLRVLVSG